MDVGQAIYVFANIGASAGILNLDTDAFPSRFPLMRWYYRILNSLFMFFNGKLLSRSDHDLLHSTIQREQQSQKAHRQAPERNRVPTDS